MKQQKGAPTMGGDYEIEITPKMVEAGFQVLCNSGIADSYLRADRTLVAEIFRAMASHRHRAGDGLEAQKELCAWLLWYLENECSLDPSCVSPADRNTLENAIKNTFEAAERVHWQPIEAAPKDGTKLLALCQPRYVETGEPMSLDYVNVVWWRGEKFKDSRWQWRHSLTDSAAEPTHWQPLPSPPEQP